MTGVPRAASCPRTPRTVSMVDFAELITNVIASGASDLHLSVGAPPVMRLNGELVRIGDRPLTSQDTRELVYGLLNQSQRQRLETDLELDLSYAVPGKVRFRVNAYYQRASLGAAFRVVPTGLKSLEELSLPASLREWTHKPRGLVLVTGPTGSGKSTTLASLVNEINEKRSCHIMTVEDPIEFLHRHKRSMINQREVGADTLSFANALRSVLRQDPDVVLIGEMRDKETIEIALTVAETGHLVFGTLHTNSAVQTITRIIDVFPADQQDQVRTQLALVLQGVICQQLLPRIGGGRVMCAEIMIASPAVRASIRENKVHQMDNIVQVSGKFGMQTMNQALLKVFQSMIITRDEALARSNNPSELQSLMERDLSGYGETN